MRLSIFEHEHRKALRMKRLPTEAQDVYEETVAKQKRRVTETSYQKEERTDNKFT